MRLQEEQAALAAYRNPKGKRYNWDGTPEPGPSFEEQEAARLQATAKAHAALNARYGLEVPNPWESIWGAWTNKTPEEIRADIQRMLQHFALTEEDYKRDYLGAYPEWFHKPDPTPRHAREPQPDLVFENGSSITFAGSKQEELRSSNASFDPRTGDLSTTFVELPTEALDAQFLSYLENLERRLRDEFGPQGICR